MSNRISCLPFITNIFFTPKKALQEKNKISPLMDIIQFGQDRTPKALGAFNFKV